MNIPAVIISEAHQSPMDDEEPTIPGSDASKLWCEAALQLARKLVECGNLKRRCADLLDPEGSERVLRMAKELHQLARVVDNLSELTPEMSAELRRKSVDRIVAIYEEASPLMMMLAA